MDESNESPLPDGHPARGPASAGALSAAVLVEVFPTKVWIESDLFGGRHVVLHHHGSGKPFTYASFHYNYAYTSNSGTWEAAHRLALALGATEPVEDRILGLKRPTADDLRAEIASMQKMLANIDSAGRK